MAWARIVGAVAAAVVLWSAATGAQAALVRYRMVGLVPQSGVFPDGSAVPEGSRVTVQLSYESAQPALEMQRNADGSGRALYAFGAPYRFRLSVEGHGARAEGFEVELLNDLNQPFGDVFEVRAQGGAWVDSVWQPGGQWTVSLMSQAGHTDALRSLDLPRRLDEWAFDAFRVGRLTGADDATLLMFNILHVKSVVCRQPVPGTDKCDD